MSLTTLLTVTFTSGAFAEKWKYDLIDRDVEHYYEPEGVVELDVSIPKGYEGNMEVIWRMATDDMDERKKAFEEVLKDSNKKADKIFNSGKNADWQLPRLDKLEDDLNKQYK
jgi:hypothetical protein